MDYFYWLDKFIQFNILSQFFSETIYTRCIKCNYIVLHGFYCKFPYRPLVLSNFSDNLCSLFILNILSVPGLILHLSSITPDVSFHSFVSANCMTCYSFNKNNCWLQQFSKNDCELTTDFKKPIARKMAKIFNYWKLWSIVCKKWRVRAKLVLRNS